MFLEKSFEPHCDKTNKMAVCPTKTQISLGIRPVWSESSLCAPWVAKDPSFLHANSEDPDQTGQMPSVIWVSAGRTATLLVLSWGGSFIRFLNSPQWSWKIIFIFQTFLILKFCNNFQVKHHGNITMQKWPQVGPKIGEAWGSISILTLASFSVFFIDCWKITYFCAYVQN